MYQREWETLARRELERLQLVRLRRTLSRIFAHNPFYKARFKGVDPEQLKDLRELEGWPFLNKEDLREGYPYRYACAPLQDFMRMHTSSGTTGTPIICPYTEGDIRQWGEVMARCYRAAGIGRDDVIQITPSFGLFNGGFGFHYGAEALGAMVIPIGAGRSALQLQFMRDLGTTALTAIASYPLRLMEVARGNGFDFRETKLRVGIFGAEVWSDGLRRRIEEGMGIETFDIIGMTETGGVGMGIDCSAHEGIHVWEDHYLVEIVDPITGEQLDDGREGELVVTTLTREALPLIRYRTRDITAILTRERCRCGRTSLRLDRIKGRADDMLVVKGVNFYPMQVESLILAHPEMGPDYQLILERVEGKEKVSLKIEVSQEIRPEAGRVLAQKLNDFLGFKVDLEFLPWGTLPRGPGKAVRVIDRRGNR